MSNNSIKIRNEADGITVIDIEGEIGVPEEVQFEEPESRVATYRKFKDMVGSIAGIRTPKVVVNIRSTGGDVGDALLIYDALCGLDATITTRSTGYVASAATIIAQAASAGEREMTSESLYLIHRSVSMVEGDAETMRHNADLLDKTDERIAEVYASRSGRNVEEFLQLMSENDGLGRWLSPEEAVECGLVDRIIDREQRRKTLGQRIKAAVAGVFNKTPNEEPKQQPKVARSTIKPSIPTEVDAGVEKMRKAQQGADKTRLAEIEDPSVCDVRQSFNEMAYTKDAENFKFH